MFFCRSPKKWFLSKEYFALHEEMLCVKSDGNSPPREKIDKKRLKANLKIRQHHETNVGRSKKLISNKLNPALATVEDYGCFKARDVGTW